MTASISPQGGVWVHHLPAQTPSCTHVFTHHSNLSSQQVVCTQQDLREFSTYQWGVNPPPPLSVLKNLKGKVYIQTLALPHNQPNYLVKQKAHFILEVRTSQGCWQLRLGYSHIIQINNFLAELGFHMLTPFYRMTGDSLFSTF